MKLVFVLVLLLVCVRAFGQSSRTQLALDASFAALEAADAGTTEAGFRTGHWIESNPLISKHSTADRMAYFFLAGAAVICAGHGLRHRGHKKLAAALLVGAIAVEGYSVTHNLVYFPY